MSDGATQVLLLGGARVRRATVALAVRLAGHTILEATTPLEAISRLQEDESRIGIVVVAGHLGSVTGEELTEFLTSTFPEVRVVAAFRPSSLVCVSDGTERVRFPPRAQSWSEGPVRASVVPPEPERKSKGATAVGRRRPMRDPTSWSS